MEQKRRKDVTALVAEIRAYAQAHADPKNALKFARYFKEGYDAWGMLDKDHEFWHARHQEWQAKYAALELPGFIEAGRLLFRSGKYEEGSISIRFVKTLMDEFRVEHLGALAGWFDGGIRNWAHTDVLCGEILAPLVAEGRIPWKALAPWRKAADRFQRRAVPVALLTLLKTSADVTPLVEFIRPLMTDPERVVHQGTGWFLREAWKRQPKPVEAFLWEWKDTAPRLIFQYATEKMTAAQKARFRAVKKPATSKAR